MKGQLDFDTACRKLQDILQEKVLLVVGTGSSIAVDFGFGMGALQEKLVEEFDRNPFTQGSAAAEQWLDVKQKMQNGHHLENALKNVNDEILLKNIVNATARHLIELDKKYRTEIFNGETQLPIGPFIKKLFHGLPQNNPVLDIITPNYDLLLEHYCDMNRMPHLNGFVGGIRKYYHWGKALESMKTVKTVTIRKRQSLYSAINRHIRFHKIHGSLNWFRQEDCIFEDNSLLYEEPPGIERAIVTPGDSKYKEVLTNLNKQILNNADRAISDERAFVFVGYGFNDEHIQIEIEKKLIDKKMPGIIITKEFSENSKKLLKKADKLWAVHQHDSGTNICNKNYKEPLFIENSDLWKIDNFTHTILED